MNKIVIIGNGFDLAHGLKTSYKDLMSFIKEDANLDKKGVGKCGTIHYDKKDFIAFKSSTDRTCTHNFAVCPNSNSIYFKELFTQYDHYEKWMDLESLYYKLLKKDYKNLKRVKIINEEFDYLKELLQKYLSERVENELPINHPNFRACFFEDRKNNKLLGLINFNYTEKVIGYHLNYLDRVNRNFYHDNFNMVNIHGELNNLNNPIIFGYGDDNSAEYKNIQNQEEKELLKNFKTFQYLRTQNYHQVLAMLEIEKDINIEIIGHSCGLSDKTLLKTIFQHPNVKKIEYRFHGNEDNYFENIYSISRIFDDNVLMRKKLFSLKETVIIPKLSFK